MSLRKIVEGEKSFTAQAREDAMDREEAFDALIDACLGRKEPPRTGAADRLEAALARMAEEEFLKQHPSIRFHDRPEDIAADQEGIMRTA